MAVKTLPKNNLVTTFEAAQVQQSLPRIPILKAAGIPLAGLTPLDILLAEGAIDGDPVVLRIACDIMNSGAAPKAPWEDDMKDIAAEFQLPELIDTRQVTIIALGLLTEEQRSALRDRVLKKIGKL